MKSKMQKFSSTKKKIDITKKRKDFKKIQQKRKKPRQTDDAEIEALTARLWPSFDQPKEDIKPSDVKTFTDLPISKKTLEGLNSHKFTTPTDIQRESLMFGLKGHDILGAAKTGSGKTLAFLIPILETLFKQRYTPSFGMAALVISPTRELAYQSFDVLKKIGKLHDLSFGLVTGGMPLKEEAKKMNTTNVVICTPGRLQQHFEQTPNFTADELKVLVLDEADRILHMGFSETMNAIIEALPRQRQTLLFSATQTKSVKDLARLSLKRPIYVSVHEKAKETTPTSLDQRYIVCEMQDKVNTLWSFLKSHKHKKILVFLSCCKQTRYLYQVFKLMHPGLTVLCLHGHMKQHKRMEVYNTFSRKQHAVLLATDVAARGLDFPVVNWVVQLDKPENTDTYIHRVGRTARYEKSGEALLVLLPTEEQKFVEDLHKRKIPIAKLKVSKKRIFDVTKKLESLCAANKDLKDNAQKAFISVMKTHYVLDKPSFEGVDIEAFAASLGLVQAPRLPFLDKRKAASKDSAASLPGSSKENSSNTGGEDESSSEDDESDGDSEDDDSVSDEESEKEIGSAAKSNGQKATTLDFGIDSDEDGNENIYNIVKDVRKFNDEENADTSEQTTEFHDEKPRKKKSRAKEKLKLLKHTTRITFDEEGNIEGKEESDEDTGGLNIDKAKERMKDEDKRDKELHRQRVKEKHREKRLKEKEKRRQAERDKRGQADDEEMEVTLGNPDEGVDGENSEVDESQEIRRLESGDEEEDESDGLHDSDDDEDDDDEPKAKRPKLSNRRGQEKSSSDEDTDEDDEDHDREDDYDSESEIETDTLAKEEAAVLAMLNGKK